MKNRNKLEIKYVFFEKLVRFFGLEKAVRISRRATDIKQVVKRIGIPYSKQ